jgi:hypothetical protein
MSLSSLRLPQGVLAIIFGAALSFWTPKGIRQIRTWHSHSILRPR